MLMKIIYLHQYFALPESNGGSRSYEMARRLVASGHEVTMITTSAFLPESYRKKGWHRFEADGIQVNSLYLPYSNKTPFGKRIFIFLTFVISAIWRAKKTHCDLVFATSTPLTIAISGIALAFIHKVPFVFEVRDLWPEVPIAIGALRNPILIFFARALEKFAYSYAKKIIVLSPGMANGVIRTGIPPEKLNIIPNCSNIEYTASTKSITAFRQKYSWLNDKKLVVYTGTIGFINGLSYLVDLACETKKLCPEIMFAVIGEGIEELSIKNYAEEKGVLNNNFFLLPPVAKKDIPIILGAADLALSLVLPIKELWNNSANKFFDALASATPIAINYYGWQAKLLQESGAGIILDPLNPAIAAQTLIDFLKNKKKIIPASSAAHNLALVQFNVELLFNKFENVLYETLNSHYKQ